MITMVGKPPTVGRHTARLGPPYQPGDYVALSCSCGFATDWHRQASEQLSHAAMREHLADEHGAALGAGRCAGCGTPTDYLRAGDTYLCADCGPSPEQWNIATGAQP